MGHKVIENRLCDVGQAATALPKQRLYATPIPPMTQNREWILSPTTMAFKRPNESSESHPSVMGGILGCGWGYWTCFEPDENDSL